MNMNYKKSTLALAVVALLAGCGAEDNKDINDDNNNIYPPIIKGEMTIPALHVGLEAKGAYQYFDPNPIARPEGVSLYSWRDENETELSTEQTLELTYELMGENVKFCVIPVAQGSISNVGEEDCSAARVVNDVLGEKPVADNVQLDNVTPTVGDTLTGSYDYTHADGISEGNTVFTWYADNSLIADASAQTLVLLANQSEGKAVKFCVSPVTSEEQPVRGDESCSVATANVLAKEGSAPEAQNTAITGDPFVGATLTGSYDFVDADGDLEGSTTVVWKRDSEAISAATDSSYLAVGADEDTDLTFCVTPVAATGDPSDGIEACSAAMNITMKVEVPPVASDVVATVQSVGGIAEAGEVLVSSYTYTQSESASEGDSTGNWIVAGVEQPECTPAQACEYPLTQADVGQTISFCVTPKTALGTPGLKECSADVTPMGIKLSGVLEYDQTLTAVVVGYTEAADTGEWKVDVSNQNGAEVGANDNPTVQFTGVTYKIGVREGTANDFDWVDRGDGLDARNFIGKDVQYCLTTEHGEKCANAADYSDVDGGLYVDANDASKRAVEPIRTYQFGDATYHRSLTVAESTLKAQAGFGASIPTAQHSTPINGIEWALFVHDNSGSKDALNVCRNLYTDSGEWHLPEGYLSRSASALETYLNNMYSVDEGYDNNPPIVGADSLNNLTKNVISSTYDSKDSDNTAFAKDIYMSRVFGWPVSTDDTGATDTTPRVTYASATKYIAGNNIDKTYIIRMYNVGSSTGNAAIDSPLFVSCVK